MEPSTIAFTTDRVEWDKVLQYVKDNLKGFLFEQADYTTRGYTRETVEAEVKYPRQSWGLEFVSRSKRLLLFVIPAYSSGAFCFVPLPYPAYFNFVLHIY
ncbi:MAG: hypothetical protein LBP81_00925, partial [Treponema sp.]|nr:hypothetical protein [Treponema sp.]